MLDASTPPAVGEVDFGVLVERLPHIVWIVGVDGVTEYLNTRGSDYAGPAAMVGAVPDWSALIHPDELASAERRWHDAGRRPRPFNVEFRLRRVDGAYRWHLVRMSPIRDALGSVVKWVGTATDINDVKMSETHLRSAERNAAESLALLETIQSNAPVGFGFVDREFRRVRINQALAEFNGSTVEELMGTSVPEVSPLLWSQVEPAYRRVLDYGESVLDVEVTGPPASNSSEPRQWLISYYPVELGDEIIGIGVVAVEITQLRQAERTQQLMSAIVEGSGDAIFASTLDGLITTWNGGAERLFGYTAAEVVGMSVAVLAPDDLVSDDVSKMRARLTAGGPAERHDTQRRRKDGSLVDVHIIASPVTDQAGAVVGLSVIVEDITERIRSQRGIETSRRRLAEAQRIAEVGSFEFDPEPAELTWSAELYRIVGLDTAVPASADLFFSMVHPDDRDAVVDAWSDAATHGIGFGMTFRMTRADGKQVWVEGRTVAEIDPDGELVKLSGTLRDATERVGAARAKTAADTRIEAGFEQGGIGSGILGLDGIPTRVNAAACKLMGRPEQELVGCSWVGFSHPDDVPLATAMTARLAAGHDTYSDERRYIRPDGSVIWAAVHITMVRDDTGEPAYFLAQLQDIGERKEMEAELIHQALFDRLTGLANRALLTDRLTNSLTATRRRAGRLSVIFLDLDNFKAVNDTLGHTAGDELLTQVGARIADAIRPSDTVARFGGDEFVIICEDASSYESEQVAEGVRTAINMPFLVGTNELHITASMGIARADENATLESLLGDGDAAMYVAKRLGRDRVEVFDNTLRATAEGRMATASALRHALERNEFVLHFQPVIDLHSGSMVSAEALLRWEHPERGIISPLEFIPLAEETGLIIPIGAWVLEQACLQLVEWRRHDPMMSIAVNLSVRQMLAPDVAGVIADILTRTGVPPSAVCLELTESVFMEDAEYFGATLAAIKALGVTLAIDDFGTGYSSLSYLKRFPVDSVKIDRAFVNGLGTDSHDSALVSAILAMANALGLTVIAEGIENQQQLVILKGLNCPRAQGFFLARPAPAREIDRLICESHHWQVE